MADIKTHLRELSVAATVGLLIKGIEFKKEDFYDSRLFLKYCEDVLDSNISNLHNLRTTNSYDHELRTILDNGYKLGKKIFESNEFKINKSDKIKWLGNDTQKGNPIDLKIGTYSFSLKEESFILHNMGLYSLLNVLTNSTYERGLHVFATFASKEYDSWFEYTWSLFLDYLQSNVWTHTKGNDVAKAFIDNTNVIMLYNNEKSIVPITIKTNAHFMEYTCSKTREKVFSKWVSRYATKIPHYIKLKKLCSETAGQKVCTKIMSEYKDTNVYSFFQIYDFTYYYAKTTTNETTILKVPSKQEFNSDIKFLSCNFEVPASQLNVVSTFINEKTQKTLQFRNECRFSHGQFNGTPEAKMYTVKNTPLTELYIPIKE